MNTIPRRSGTVIEHVIIETGTELHEIVPARPDSPIPTTEGLWTIRQPSPPAALHLPPRSASDDR